MCVFSLKCKYTLGWVLGLLYVLVWNASIRRLVPMSNVGFSFGMQILQGWVLSPMCV